MTQLDNAIRIVSYVTKCSFTLQYCVESQIRQRGCDPATSLLIIEPRQVLRIGYVVSFWLARTPRRRRRIRGVFRGALALVPLWR